jgi:hypothetical protein
MTVPYCVNCKHHVAGCVTFKVADCPDRVYIDPRKLKKWAERAYYLLLRLDLIVAIHDREYEELCCEWRKMFPRKEGGELYE